MPLAEFDPLGLAVWGLTDVGRVRSENQDEFLAIEFAPGASGERAGAAYGSKADPSKDDARVEHSLSVGSAGALLLVADGMGGAMGGATASGLAVSTVVQTLRRRRPMRDETTARSLGHRLEEAVEEANLKIRARAADDIELRGMGTTLTGVGVVQDGVVCVQVGDSRAYLFRGGTLVQLTRDQTMVQELLDAGVITAEEARRSDQRNLILQAVGSSPNLDIVVTYQELSVGDVILLCSDGLSGVVDDTTLAQVLTKSASPREACEVLVRKANDAGGPDNITILVGQVRRFTPSEDR